MDGTAAGRDEVLTRRPKHPRLVTRRVSNHLEEYVAIEAEHKVAPTVIEFYVLNRTSVQQLMRRGGGIHGLWKPKLLTVIRRRSTEDALDADPPQGLDGQRSIRERERPGVLREL